MTRRLTLGVAPFVLSFIWLLPLRAEDGWKPPTTMSAKKVPKKSTIPDKKPSPEILTKKTAEAPAPGDSTPVPPPTQTQATPPSPVAPPSPAKDAALVEPPEPAAPTSSVNGVADLDVAKNRAKKFMKNNEYMRAREAALSATVLAPKDAESWLILGVVEQKVEHWGQARDAFSHYLDLLPASPKQGAVRQRITELEFRQKQADEDQRKKRLIRYGALESGFFFGYSPVFRPAFSRATNDLVSNISDSLWLGFRADDTFTFGIRASKGTVAQTFTTSLNFDVSHIFGELFFEPDVPLNRPYHELSIFQLYIPIHLGVPFNYISLPNDGAWNVGAALGTGLGVRAYTTSFVVIDIAGMYNVGFPFWGLKGGTSNAPLRNPVGSSAQGRMTGFDLRILVHLLF